MRLSRGEEQGRQSGRRGRHTTTLLRLGFAALIAATTTLTVVPAAEAAPLEQHTPATYNMQGASAETASKWSSDIRDLTAGHDVLALQEAGPVPALTPGGSFNYVNTYGNGAGAVHHYTRNFGTSSRPLLRQVYFLRTDQGGNRVNLAMVTRNQPDEVVIVPPTFATSRWSFGLRFGQTVFFTVHALSGGGNDGPGMVRRIAQFTAQHGWDYAVMGDFNRDPDRWAGQLPQGSFLYRSGQATQQSAGELDYMIASRAVQLYEGRRLGGYSSDHYPVDFQVFPLRAAAMPVSIGSYSNHGGSERILDIYQNESGNGTHVITYDPNGGRNQLFNLVPAGWNGYTIRSVSTGKCVDLDHGPNARESDFVNEWDCQGQSTQIWRFYGWPDDPGAVLVYNPSKNMCLDVLGNRTGNGRWPGIYRCTGAINQKWTLQDRTTS